MAGHGISTDLYDVCGKSCRDNTSLEGERCLEAVDVDVDVDVDMSLDGMEWNG